MSVEISNGTAAHAPSRLDVGWQASVPGAADPRQPTFNQWADLVSNALLVRTEVFKQLMDPRRSIDQECGYPDSETGFGPGGISPDLYKTLYHREAVATRVAQVMPKECWQSQPTVFEDDDPNSVTAFEEAWDALGRQLRGEQSWYQDEFGSPVWEHLMRADILSGIGAFGVLLLGIDDGRRLDEPVEGVMTLQAPYSRQQQRGLPLGYGPDLVRSPFAGTGPAPVPAPPQQPFSGEDYLSPFPSPGMQLGGTMLNSRNGSNGNSNGRPGHISDDLNPALNHRVAAFYGSSDYQSIPGRELTTDPRTGKPFTDLPYARNGNGTVHNAADILPPAPGIVPPTVTNGVATDSTTNTATDSATGPTANIDYLTPDGMHLSSSGIGTDAQYVGIQLGPSEFPIMDDELDPHSLDQGYPWEKPQPEQQPQQGTQPQGQATSGTQPQRRLLFLRSFDESLVQIVQYEANVRNPRFGLPVMYRITLNDPRELHTGIGLPMATVRVHWTRVIHIADNLNSSEIFGVPRMRPVLNRLLDLRKLYSGSAEMYWRGAFPGLSLETAPQLGGDVRIDVSFLQDQMEQYFNGLQRYLALMGMQAKTLSPTVVDPGQQIDVQITAICIQLGIPKRVFMGSERGELASSQDDSKWNDEIRGRQNNYLTPRLIVPFIDRLIQMGVLPRPRGYSVEWPDVDSLSPQDKVQLLLQKTQALTQFVSGQGESAMPLADYYTRVWDMDEKDVETIMDNLQQAQMQAGGAGGADGSVPGGLGDSDGAAGDQYDASDWGDMGEADGITPPRPDTPPPTQQSWQSPPEDHSLEWASLGEGYEGGYSPQQNPDPQQNQELTPQQNQELRGTPLLSTPDTNDDWEQLADGHEGTTAAQRPAPTGHVTNRSPLSARLADAMVANGLSRADATLLLNDFVPTTISKGGQEYKGHWVTTESGGHLFISADGHLRTGPEGKIIARSTEHGGPEHPTTTDQGRPGRPGAEPAHPGGSVATTPTGSGAGPGSEGGQDRNQPAGPEPARRLPARVEEVNRRLDRYGELFRSRGNHQAADWMRQLREHINAVGVDHALDALGPEVKGKGEKVQYGGYDLDDAEGNRRHDADFIENYLNRAGISLIQGSKPEGPRRAISTVSASSDEEGLHERGGKEGARDYFPKLQGLRDKLHEAQHLPGLEKSEDLGKVLHNEFGKVVTHLDDEAVKKLDDKYGAGKWIVKTYSEDAFAGHGIYFPQRARQLKQDAQNTIWSAGQNLSRYGFQLARDPDTKEVKGLIHESGDLYPFGSKKYDQTIQGDARQWADKAAEAAEDEHGPRLARGRGGDDIPYMVSPAFDVVGVSNEERAQGITFKRGQEGRVHITTQNGVASIVPHSTWLKQEPMPVVFENDDTRAMAQAAVDAINALPASERNGQIYAPDIVKTKDGYRVVEANPANEAGASGYLQDNPFVIDSYVSQLTGREPAHVQFIRKLLTSRKRTENQAMTINEEFLDLLYNLDNPAANVAVVNLPSGDPFLDALVTHGSRPIHEFLEDKVHRDDKGRFSKGEGGEGGHTSRGEHGLHGGHGHDSAHALEHAGHHFHNFEEAHHTVELLGGGHAAHEAIDHAAHAAGEAAHHFGALDVVAIAHRRLFGHAVKAIAHIMERVPGTRTAGRALRSLHDKVTGYVATKIDNLEKELGPATARTVLGAGSALVGMVNPVGLAGKATLGRAIPGMNLVTALPLIAVAQAGKKLGVLGPNSRTEKALAGVGTFLHALMEAAGKPIKAAARAAVAPLGKLASVGGQAVGEAVGTEGQKQLGKARMARKIAAEINRPITTHAAEAQLTDEEVQARAMEFLKDIYGYLDTILPDYEDDLRAAQPLEDELDDKGNGPDGEGPSDWGDLGEDEDENEEDNHH